MRNWPIEVSDLQALKQELIEISESSGEIDVGRERKEREVLLETSGHPWPAHNYRSSHYIGFATIARSVNVTRKGAKGRASFHPFRPMRSRQITATEAAT